MYENKLTNAKCKQKQHYRCTGLPTYQIRMFLTKKYRSFVCINCIPVSEELQIIVSRQEEGIVKSIEIKFSKTKSKSRKSNLQEESRTALLDARFSNLEKKVKEIVYQADNKKFEEVGHHIKVGFASVAERDDVLGKLHNLKNNDHYFRVDIIEDLTEDERKIVKKKHGSNEQKKRTTKSLKTRPRCGNCEEHQIQDFI